MFIPFLGLLSINLAVINFLPIPPLDGGQLVFLIAEKLRGKPLPESPVIVATLAGLTMLLLLIAFTFWNDIRNVFF
jgi:regulator of sigma E protease